MQLIKQKTCSECRYKSMKFTLRLDSKCRSISDGHTKSYFWLILSLWSVVETSWLTTDHISVLCFQSDDDSGNDSDDSERSGKRRRFDDASIEKRREKRLWEENRYIRNSICVYRSWNYRNVHLKMLREISQWFIQNSL